MGEASGSNDSIFREEQKTKSRIVASELMKVCDSPSKQSSTAVAKKMVAKDPISLQDVIEGDVVGAGYHSLAKQLQTRVDDTRTSNVPQIRKRKSRAEDSDTEEIPAEKRAAVQNTYSCMNWELKCMSLNETEVPEEQTGKLKSKAKEVSPEEVRTLTKLTYFSQRKDVNKGASIHQLFENWPFLFQEVGMGVHFKELTGINLKEMFLTSLDKKGGRLLNFMKTIGAEKKKQVMQAVEKLEVIRGQLEGYSEDIKDMVLLLLAYVSEKEEMMFHYVEQSCLAEDVEEDMLPVTPCIIVCGKHK